MLPGSATSAADAAASEKSKTAQHRPSGHAPGESNIASAAAGRQRAAGTRQADIRAVRAAAL